MNATSASRRARARSAGEKNRCFGRPHFFFLPPGTSHSPKSARHHPPLCVHSWESLCASFQGAMAKIEDDFSRRRPEVFSRYWPRIWGSGRLRNVSGNFALHVLVASRSDGA